VPEVPAVPGRAGVENGVPADLTGRATATFAAGGPLARAFPHFEPRSGQVEMAVAVARVLVQGGVLLAEAGTGTGKTLAYLIPAILSRQRVLVSTGTKNLQEQIFFKDIPALREALGVPFTATLMKGRSNYLCLHRLDQLNDEAGPVSHDVFLPIIRKWAGRTETGDRAELEGLPEDLPFWKEVDAAADTCLGTECPRYDDCFVTKMRQRAAASDVVIVNHHLLCADAAVRQNAYGEVIPACPHAIVDEAHQLEDVATQYFGYSVSTYRLEDLARDIERFAASGIVESQHDQREIAKALAAVRDHARSFFTDLVLAIGGDGRGEAGSARSRTRQGEVRIRLTEAMLANARDSAADLLGALDLTESTLALLAARRPDAGEEVADDQDVAALARRAHEIRDELRFLLRASDSEYVYFVECRGRGVFLRASPVNVAAIVRELLLDRMRTTILTSATLTVDGTFEYIRGRLGIKTADEVRLQSEFDFRSQALLYLPPRMPDPRLPDFALAAGRQVIEILKRSRGRAFVLFTSYATLREVQAIAEMALDYPMFVQGTAPRTELLRQFRQTPHSVLFATSSFWQGVDVVGEALSCVIVDKLPFASPGDPITSARIDAIRARGGEPFDEYQVPLAILNLQQGLGRLIRHRQDRGVLVVLDPRLRTKGYGRRFIESLPPAPVVHDLAAVEAFFSGGVR
jgi:ATP-dependent DNA helicase DinG